ncbi:hypothetical protein J4209_05795 [Candidatus Woesearchaeota archaeon]|nr:hypothetical protein [Candidatus Woesearchaeota archaeon]
MNKKSQGLPINMVILLILALIVLVVLIYIFSGKAGIFSRTTTTCSGKGGVCLKECTSTQMQTIGTDCAKENKVCCLET